MKKKFAVEIVETYTQVVEILSEDAESAVERAEELVNDDVIQPEVYYDDYDRNCRTAADLLGVRILDHLIVMKDGFATIKGE